VAKPGAPIVLDPSGAARLAEKFSLAAGAPGYKITFSTSNIFGAGTKSQARAPAAVGCSG
jgi:hypothetical protein